MAIIKTFINDLNSISRFHFACKYIFPLVAVFMTWGALGNFYTLTLTQNDLTANKGQVQTISMQLEIGTTQFQQIKYHPIIITLGNSSYEFRVRDNFKDWFNFLHERIHEGDTVTIYTRSTLDALISWGKKGDVYEIDKNGVVLFPLSTVKEYNNNQALILILFASILWLVFIVYKFQAKGDRSAIVNMSIAKSEADI
jgi:hypothetical protein